MKALALLCLSLVVVPLQAAELEAVNQRAIELRHLLHANPELSNRENETAALVAEELRSLGLEVETGVALTGVIGTLTGGKPGPTIAVRADMDALPVTEATGFSFASTKRTQFQGQEVGVAHACGHDIHVSVALGVARLLAAQREQLPGTVHFIFQPAEEGAPPGEEGGAKLMVQQGLLKKLKPQAIFALHAFPDWPVGEIAWTSGPVYASSARFIIKLVGKQAHGAWPHLAVDPVVMAAETVTAFQTIRSRNLDPREPGVVSVGMIHGGQRSNIIPGEVELQGTVRTYSKDVEDLIERRMQEILTGITQQYGGSFELNFERQNPATINQPELSAWARSSLEKNLGKDSVVIGEPVMGAEDFSWFANEIPGFYFRLGVVKPGTQSGALHTPTFRADDSAIPVGIKAMSGLVLDYLAENAR